MKEFEIVCPLSREPRLKEIEAIVKDPSSSLDKIDELIEETKLLASDCYAYTRGLKQKVETLADIAENN